MANERIISAITIGATATMMLIVRRLQTGQLIAVNEFICMSNTASYLGVLHQLEEHAIARTVSALNQMRNLCLNEGVEFTIVAATSAIAKAKNVDAFLSRCKEEAGFEDILLLTPDEEANLSFLGATASHPGDKPVMLVDLGGASTEIIFGIGTQRVFASSMDLGYIELTSRCRLERFFSFLAKNKAHKMVNDAIKPLFEDSIRWVEENKPIVLVSGAICSSFIGMAKGELVMSREEVHGMEGRLDELEIAYNKLMKLPAKERGNFKGIERDRAAMVPGALLILSSIMRYFHAQKYTVTADGLRLGLLMSGKYDKQSKNKSS